MKSKSFLTAIVGVFILGCGSHQTSASAKTTPEAPEIKLRPTAGNQLRLNVKVRVTGGDRKTSEAVFQAFNDQIRVFNECQSVGKSEVFFIEGEWASDANGKVVQASVKRMRPDNQTIQTCFLKQVKTVELGPEGARQKGKITVNSYRGELAPLDPKSERRFEKTL